VEDLYIRNASLLCSPAVHAWDEQHLTLDDPSGKQQAGEMHVDPIEGYYCRKRVDAEALAQKLRGQSVSSSVLGAALAGCVDDVRHVVGIFPPGVKYPVVFVRSLAGQHESCYLVPGPILVMRQQMVNVPRITNKGETS